LQRDFGQATRWHGACLIVCDMRRNCDDRDTEKADMKHGFSRRGGADNPTSNSGTRGGIAGSGKQSAVRTQRSACIDKSLIRHALCPEFAQESNKLPGSSTDRAFVESGFLAETTLSLRRAKYSPMTPMVDSSTTTDPARLNDVIIEVSPGHRPFRRNWVEHKSRTHAREFARCRICRGVWIGSRI